MRTKLFLMGCTCMGILFSAKAQNVKISGTVKNIAVAEIEIYRPYKSFFYNYFKEAWIDLPLKNGTYTVALTVNEPEMMYVFLRDTITQKLYKQNLFLKKGYNLNISFSMADQKIIVETKGIGANDNQSLLVSSDRSLQDIYEEKKDTLPARIIGRIIDAQQADSLVIAAYIKKNKPSPEFTSAWKYQLKYQVLGDYFGFSENYKYGIRQAFYRNVNTWRGLQDQLFAAVKLSDDNALVAPNYQRLIRTYISRTKERIWMDMNTNRVEMLEKWYGDLDTAAGMKAYRQDMQNRLTQKIIDKKLNGKIKEYGYGVIMENALKTSELVNMAEIYADFVKTFPNSPYKTRFQPEFDAMANLIKNPLTAKMVFVKNMEQLNTWENVLAQVKGKTVLLDMWGTWCGPCREELSKNSASIKKHFAGKGLEYLYIANHDVGQEKKWKELIAYFNLEGTHILANDKLTTDIMDKVKGTGFPTYVIIHKDGSFELSKAGYPMDREVLIKQIENALN